MRKFFAVVIVALVLSTLAAPSSSAAVKAGAACKKAGDISIAAGKKFTCVKTSGKLIWNKGVVVKANAKAKPTPKPTPKPTAMATPTAQPATSAPSAPSTTQPTPTVAATIAAGYTMAQVKANKSAEKCWSVINENVYDLTAWINAHPGGSGAILSLCGIDGTARFTSMHGNQSKPESRLAGYLLGPLDK